VEDEYRGVAGKERPVEPVAFSGPICRQDIEHPGLVLRLRHVAYTALAAESFEFGFALILN
jgi:hypothetical protein